MSNPSQEPNDPKPVGGSLTSGLTKFPGGGASELPPLPKGGRLRALGRAIIFALLGTVAGALAGLTWGAMLMWGFGLPGATIQSEVIVWMIVGFIGGFMVQPVGTLMGALAGAIVGAIIGTVVPAFFGGEAFTHTGMAAGLILGAMTGAYMGELRADASDKKLRTK
jgi:hypothetical protein